jgi:hypothetical protein
MCKRSKPKDGSRLDTACVIFMDDLYMADSTGTHVPVASNSVKKEFYQHCSESACNHDKGGKGRVDPVLKLYKDAPIMLTQNSDVANGEANGSRVFVKRINVKKGEAPFDLKLDNGTTVCGLFASQVKSLTVRHKNEDIEPEEFEVMAQSFTFTASMVLNDEKMYIKMKGTQFPIISNNCTTGHKLQGCTVEAILVNSWFYGANWAYVVLSRVKTMNGLFLRERLSYDLTKYEKPPAMKRMLQTFKDTISMEMIDEATYNTLEKVNFSIVPVSRKRTRVEADF